MRVKHKLEEVLDEGIELILEDVSVLDPKDPSLINPLLCENYKAKSNQQLRRLVISK